MAHLLGLVLLIGVVDSINPSTIAPALYLAAGKAARRGLVGFVAGGFAVNFAAGVVLALGPGRALRTAVPRPGTEALHLLELGGGCATLLLAAALWAGRGRVARHVLGNEGRIARSSLLVGAGIMLAELPTALPYFAVIATVAGSGQRTMVQIALLAIFNAVFFAPLLAILGMRDLAGERGLALLDRIRATVDRRVATLVPILVGLVAVVLLALGGVGALGD